MHKLIIFVCLWIQPEKVKSVSCDVMIYEFHDSLKNKRVCDICICAAYAMMFVKWCMSVVMNVSVVILQCCWTRENKSVIAAEDEECMSSDFVWSWHAGRRVSAIREINSVGEGKLRALYGDFVKSCWGILRHLVTSLGNFGATIGYFCSTGDVRTTNIIRHVENMAVTL